MLFRFLNIIMGKGKSSGLIFMRQKFGPQALFFESSLKYVHVLLLYRENWAHCADRGFNGGDRGARSEAASHCCRHAWIRWRHQQPGLVRIALMFIKNTQICSAYIQSSYILCMSLAWLALAWLTVCQSLFKGTFYPKINSLTSVSLCNTRNVVFKYW